MPSKFVRTLKTIGRKWFIFLVIAILIVFIFHQLAAIIMTIITIVLFAVSYIPTLFFNKKLKMFLSDYNSIEDKIVARKLKCSLPKIQEKMHNLSKKQDKKNWLIIFMNRHYIFYNEKTIEKFREYYIKGLGEKEILEKLKKSDIKTRAEIKAIEETLIENSRLEEREISVKEYRDKQRYS
jgi:ABC-type multidrug transport system fused ATPase/permease subunit